MRTIKFRGKRVDNGEWVTGDLLHNYWTNGDNFIPYAIRYLINGIFSFPIEVHPETVGQFTGLHDEGGREIYEGDIVCIYTDDVCEVEWNDDTCKFQYSNGKDINDYNTYGITKTVIGNIHDNPIQP